MWSSRCVLRLVDFDNGVSYSRISLLNRMNWGQMILIQLYCGLLLPKQQVHVVHNHSNKKEKGYDSRGVGNSVLLSGVSLVVEQA